MNARTLALLLLVAPLCACGKEEPKQTAPSGEILPGSASDAMIPEDSLTSQPPLDPGAVRHGDDGGKGEGTEAAKEERTAAPTPGPTEARPSETRPAEAKPVP